MEKKILFILHVPPPINGAAIVGQLIKNSDVINDAFVCDYINLTTSFSLGTIGKSNIGKLLTVFRIAFRTVKALLRTDYNLCYMTLTAKGPGFYKDFLIVLLLKAFGKNLIYHFHNKGVAENGKNRLNDLMYRITFRNAKCILLSPTLYGDVNRYVKEENAYFCANGIPDVGQVVQSPKRVNRKGTPCRFLFLSNMMEEKGVLILLEACKILKQKELNFECHFIGAWSDITEGIFQKTVTSLNIKDKIFVHGKKYGTDKLHFFRKADVFVFPTYYHNECFPLVLLEAMQFALPIVTTFEGGIPDLVKDSETAILVPTRDSNSLAKELEKLLIDSSLRNIMGIKARRRYEELFTFSIFEKNLRDILQLEIP